MSEPNKRVPLFERLPEIYRIRDTEQSPPDQLKAFLAAAELAFAAVHQNIEALYDDLFIDSCDDWVIPYLADLLGTSHLKGEPRTLRADVADTVALRRRKGTRGAIERLAANITAWPCRCVELLPNLAWTQHLNHQRPDADGDPAHGGADVDRFTVPRGGTVPIHDPAMLSLLGTPFDPFAYTVDIKPAAAGALHINIPNLAIFLWRLQSYRIAISRPLAKGFTDMGAPPPGSDRARYAVRFDLDPLDRPLQLFNSYRQPQAAAVSGVYALTEADAVPGPILPARLNSDSRAGNPSAYIGIDAFDDTVMPPTGLDVGDTGLQFYFPQGVLDGIAWRFRGDNLCAWEQGLRLPLRDHEIVVDPVIGRVLIGVAAASERDALVDSSGATPRAKCFTNYSYGAPGPVGAHPISRTAAPTTLHDEVVVLQPVTALGGMSLQTALANTQDREVPYVVEIRDNLVHDLDVATLPGVVTENGMASLALQRSLIIRAASGFRPVIRLATPLAFRPVEPGDAHVAHIIVRLEGVFVTAAPVFTARALITRAAVARLECYGCTLDPGGYALRDGTRAPMQRAMDLVNGYGFADEDDENAFEPTPDVLLYRSISGALYMDDGYRLAVHSSIVDAGKTVGESAVGHYALASATDDVEQWGAALDLQGATFFGRVRSSEASGKGGLFLHTLQVWNHQKGCLKQCYFSGAGDLLPPNYACVTAADARLVITASWFGRPGYAQLGSDSDFRIIYRGPADDWMGAYGFLLESHKWINLGIRLREFMPVAIRPLLRPMT